MRILFIAFCVFSAQIASALDEKTLPGSFVSIALPYFDAKPAQTMVAKDGVKIRYRFFPVAHAKGTLVIINGRSEFMREYAELIYDLRDSGYSIFVYDHRGQGESDRLISDPIKDYVGHYEDFVTDLEQLMDQVILPQSHENVFFLSHSMGGAIATDYAIQHPRVVRAMVSSSPMYEINLGAYPEAIAKLILGEEILTGHGEDYAKGHSADDWKQPFKGNLVTNSAARYQYSMDELIKNPKLIISGPTNRWVFEAILLGERDRFHSSWLATPTLVLQAGDEELVVPLGMDEVVSSALDAQLMKFPTAKHEIFMEKDEVRNKAIQATLSFFAQATAMAAAQ